MLRVGIDIGSTTIKCVVIDEEGTILYKDYMRHKSSITQSFTRLVQGIQAEFNGASMVMNVTGSAGMLLATEIGIQEITPIICDRSERKVINPERFEKIILSAMKQSNALYLPKLNPAISFKEFVKQKKGGLQLIAHCEETDKKTLKTVLEPNTDVTLLIGPEGDFSEKEIVLALEQHYIPVTLGTTRLRTETAAVVACHSVVFFNEN